MAKIIIVMPAYNAANTLEPTIRNLPKIYSKIIVCDDASQDQTVKISRKLKCTTITHLNNKGYGANQKTLYNAALKYNPDIIVMVHPDNQYNTTNVSKMIKLVTNRKKSLVLGVRTKTALVNHMPLWKFLSNRGLTRIQNVVYRQSLSEYHTGLRAYDATMIKQMPYELFSNNFCFDSEVIAWAIANNYAISEIDAQCYYTKDSSSIKVIPSIKYGLNTLNVLFRFKNGYYNRLDNTTNKTYEESIEIQ